MARDEPDDDPTRLLRAHPDRVTDRGSFVTEIQLFKDRSAKSFRDIARATGGGAGHPLPFTSIRAYVSGTSFPRPTGSSASPAPWARTTGRSSVGRRRC